MKGKAYKSINEQCLRITHSMDPETSIQELYGVLQAYLPLIWINLAIYDSSRQTLRYLAMITEAQTMIVDEPVKISQAGLADVEKTIRDKTLRWNDVARYDLGKDILKYLEIDRPIATLALAKKMDSLRYAVIGMVANGRDRYNDQHFELLKALYHPLAEVSSHILTQLEMSKRAERLTIENRELKKRLGYLSDQGFVGFDTGLREVITKVKQVAPLDSPVLLIGETGVGKEVVAKEIHRRSKRANDPIVSVNCGAIPESLVDSELFGHEKGAFTGAQSLKRGYFEQADGGTVFLDEIGELTLRAQVRLLRMLQSMEFQRVGGSRTLYIDVRIIAATNRNLVNMIKKQRFRMDLWFRINVVPIEIPPLRERKEDILPLAEYFIQKKSKEMNLSYDAVLAPEAVAQLQDYEWPGNIRELRNVIERALITSQGKPLSFENLVELPSEACPKDILHSPAGFMKMDDMIALHIRRSLSLTEGRVAGRGGAAELLGMHPSTLRARMRKLGIRINRSAN